MPKEKNSRVNNSSHSSKPYNASNSFVKQVTTRVSHLLPRLSNWFAPQLPSDEVPARTSHDRTTDDEEEDEAVRPPPAKLMRTELNAVSPIVSHDSSGIKKNPFATVFGQNNRVQLDYGDGSRPGPSGLQGRPCLASSTPAAARPPPLDINLQSPADPLTNGDDQSVHSESSVSTSGCSSLIPQSKGQVDSRKYSASGDWLTLRGNRDSLSFQTRSKIFSPDVSLSPRANSSLRGRPSFDPTVFSNPLSPSGLSNTSDRNIQSPFYPGRTQYGGASAYKKPRNSLFLPSFLPNTTQHQPLRHSIQVKPLNSTDLADLNSCTSRRILDVLDHLSSPVLDAKRIPVTSSPALAGTSRKRPAPESSPTLRKSGGPPTQDLTIATVPDLLKMQRRNKMQDSMEAARLIAVSPSTTSLTAVEKEYKMRLDNSPAKPAGKMTSKMKDLEEEMREEVVLPNVALPISTLPKFDFLASKLPRRKYTFSAPTELNSNEFLIMDSFGNNFKYAGHTSSQPTTAFGNKSSILGTTSKINSVPDFIPNCSTSKETRITKSNSETSKSNGQSISLGFGINVADSLKTGSVIDVLLKKGNGGNDSGGKLTSKPDTSVPLSPFGSSTFSTPPTSAPVSQPLGFGNMFKKPAGSWECSACMVRNNAEASTCVSCTTAKPSAPQVKPLVNKETPSLVSNNTTLKTSDASLNSISKPASSTWECSTCLVRNKPEVDFCVCCESKRPTAAGLVVSKPAPTSGFGDMFKKPEGSWVCSDCMLSNKDTAVKCVACEAAKPGTESKTASTVKYNFSMPPEASTFKFGVDKAVDVGIKKLEPSTAPCFQFGSSKPSSEPAASFVFGSGAKSVVSTDTKSFTFGIPAKPTAPVTAPTTNTFVNTVQPTTMTPSTTLPPASSNGPTVFSISDSERKRKAADNPFASAVMQPAEPVKPVETTKSTFAFGVPSSNSTPTVNFNGLRKEDASSSELKPSVTASSIFSFGSTKSAASSFPTNNAMLGAPTSTVTTTINKPFVFGSASSNQSDEPTAKKLAGAFSTGATKEFGGFGTLASSAPKFSTTGSASGMFGTAASTPSTGTTFGSTFGSSGFGTANVTKPDSAVASVTPFMFGSSNNSVIPQKPTSLFPTANAVSQETPQFGNNPQAPKPGVFSFGSSSNEPTSTQGVFGFSAVPPKPTGTFSFGSANATSNQPTSGFSMPGSNAFGSAPTSTGFGGSATPVFGQSTTGGFNFPAAAAPPGFNFQPVAPNAFNPNVRPQFNFTGGDVPQFTAAVHGYSSASAPLRRVIKKAVRRAPRD